MVTEEVAPTVGPWSLPALVTSLIAGFLVGSRSTYNRRGRRLLHDSHDNRSATLSDARIARSPLEDLYSLAGVRVLGIGSRVGAAWRDALAAALIGRAEDLRRDGDYVGVLTLIGSLARSGLELAPPLRAAALTRSAAARLASRRRDGGKSCAIRALREAEAAVRLAPGCGDARAQSGRALLAFSRYTEAVVEIEQALADRSIVDDALADDLSAARRSARSAPSLTVTVTPSGPWVSARAPRNATIRADAPLKALLAPFGAGADLRLVDGDGRALHPEYVAAAAGVRDGASLLAAEADRRRRAPVRRFAERAVSATLTLS